MKDGNHFNKQGRESEEMTARWAVPAGREGKPSGKTENAAKYAAKDSRNAGFDRKEKKYSPDGERKGFDPDRRESGFARGAGRGEKPGFDRGSKGGFGSREERGGFDRGDKYNHGEKLGFGGKKEYGQGDRFGHHDDRGEKPSFGYSDRKPGFVKPAVKPAPAKAKAEEPFWVKGSGARNAPSAGDSLRLHKYMAMCGAASRRACEELIRQGKVTVNGTVITEMGVQVGPRDEVRLEGRLLRPETVKKYVIYHKPAGEVTTVNDPEGRACVLDHFRDYPVRLYPVGRLDYDSEGLLLLTNDGDLTERMLHPSHEVDKTYLARVTGDVTLESVQKLRSGILLDDHKTSPAKVRVIKRETFATVVLVTIHEGRYRQVRRMFEALEHKVLQLRRVEFGPLQLGDLPRGQWRELTSDEVRRLKASL